MRLNSADPRMSGERRCVPNKGLHRLRRESSCRHKAKGVASKSHASACQKSLFDKLVDGGASSPATATPSRFHVNPSDSGREICKVAIFSPENRIFLRKNQLRARRIRRRARFLWLSCIGFLTV